jgi:outer membrane protein TolC
MPMVGVRQMVPFAGRIAADRRALRAEADLAAALARGTAQDAALVAVGAAVQAAARREEVRAIGRSLEALDILIASVTSRYRTGGTLLADVAMLKVERGDTAAMLREAEAMVAEAAAMWSGVFPRATMPLLDSGPDAAWTPPSTDAIVDASPLVMAAGAERDAAQAMRTSARAAFAPDLELSTAVDVRDTGPVMDIAVAVSLPLWAPWGQEPRLRAASADLGAAEAVWATRRAEVGAQAAAATARWAAARDREDMFRNQIVPYAEAAALSARAAYEAGQVPVVAVIDAIRDEWSNRSRAADVTAERRLWEARILALAGHLVRAASERSGVSK